MPEVGIVMTLKDRVSDEMNRIQNSGRALNKEFDELYERVNKTTALPEGRRGIEDSSNQKSEGNISRMITIEAKNMIFRESG